MLILQVERALLDVPLFEHVELSFTRSEPRGAMNVLGAVHALLFESVDKNPDAHCMPWIMQRSDQCQYVHDHGDVCGEGTGLVPYMKIYYCTFNFRYDCLFILCSRSCFVS
jgi:hypothetical protein